MRIVDVMTINHFVSWYIIGCYFPNNLKLLIGVSLLWELFETMICQRKNTYDICKKYWSVPEAYWNESIENKVGDFIFNWLGYIIGSKSKKSLRIELVIIWFLTFWIASLG